MEDSSNEMKNPPVFKNGNCEGCQHVFGRHWKDNCSAYREFSKEDWKNDCVVYPIPPDAASELSTLTSITSFDLNLNTDLLWMIQQCRGVIVGIKLVPRSLILSKTLLESMKYWSLSGPDDTHDEDTPSWYIPAWSMVDLCQWWMNKPADRPEFVDFENWVGVTISTEVQHLGGPLIHVPYGGSTTWYITSFMSRSNTVLAQGNGPKPWHAFVAAFIQWVTFTFPVDPLKIGPSDYTTTINPDTGHLLRTKRRDGVNLIGEAT